MVQAQSLARELSHATGVAKTLVNYIKTITGVFFLKKRQGWLSSRGSRSFTPHCKRSGRFAIGGDTWVGKDRWSLAQQNQEGQQKQGNSRWQGWYRKFGKIQVVLRIKQPSERVRDEPGEVGQTTA